MRKLKVLGWSLPDTLDSAPAQQPQWQQLLPHPFFPLELCFRAHPLASLWAPGLQPRSIPLHRAACFFCLLGKSVPIPLITENPNFLYKTTHPTGFAFESNDAAPAHQRTPLCVLGKSPCEHRAKQASPSYISPSASLHPGTTHPCATTARPEFCLLEPSVSEQRLALTESQT